MIAEASIDDEGQIHYTVKPKYTVGDVIEYERLGALLVDRIRQIEIISTGPATVAGRYFVDQYKYPVHESDIKGSFKREKHEE